MASADPAAVPRAATRLLGRQLGEGRMARNVGWYSNRSRGERAKHSASGTVVTGAEYLSEFATRAKTAWAKLIRKVYEVDLLECSR